MKTSQLQAILNRLEAMTADDSEIEVRRFEFEGQERCQVRYDRETESFELQDHTINESFQFDDIDLVAIEIFELLQ
ncbi:MULTISPECIES: YkuJ family protein [Aerococcus]|uniref:DUF1797 family protein n=1 Tax=Aerococcus sanguinicola TaxID=119206 RepID=A0A5N1GMF6_9LACT|nr:MULTISPECIES: YkuJ family protein [Aerococcus]KAA9302147.1 DUF1797 family protein [Aerococcus sanguinicola]MDK6368422.1 YkuJ family protein [Aerococcus sp. UMB9870]MDK6679505.1 YkuJ family protein [Aerococcus sp. UMB8608]MDK6686349.1 YkuJ family protein [Aerococcus sp. UMB8623]MDK6941029.1 YkuJ family protein [Aerococcus sp. UMB8487]